MQIRCATQRNWQVQGEHFHSQTMPSTWCASQLFWIGHRLMSADSWSGKTTRAKVAILTLIPKEKRWREPKIYQCPDNNLWFENGLHKRCGSPMMNRDDMTPFERHFSLRKDRAQGVAFCQPHIGTRLQFWLLYLTVTSSRI